MKNQFDTRKTSKKHTQSSHLQQQFLIVNSVFSMNFRKLDSVTICELTSYKCKGDENCDKNRTKRIYNLVGSGKQEVFIIASSLPNFIPITSKTSVAENACDSNRPHSPKRNEPKGTTCRPHLCSVRFIGNNKQKLLQ